MNLEKVREIIALYKKNFKAISNEEIYKWQAIKCFQDNWDSDADNFALMLKNSLKKVGNLMDSGYYYPKRMILNYAEKEPETLRIVFKNLFDVESDWIERILSFQSATKLINEKYYPGKLSYQDKRALMVYLVLHYPNTFFLYKYKMFKMFVEKIDYPYKPKKGSLENISVYHNLCELLQSEISKDAELIELHKSRLTEKHFFDESLNVLTQDIIYASVKPTMTFQTNVLESAKARLIKIDKVIEPKAESQTIILKGSHRNYIEIEKNKKRIGDLGELLVLEYEREKLKNLKSKKEPEHIAKTKGDGEGYDILSYDEFGKEIYIEVKTTKKGFNSPFYITKNELEKSIISKERYYLYRLFDYDETTNTAKFRVKQGDLKSLCIYPETYRVIAED